MKQLKHSFQLINSTIVILVLVLITAPTKNFAQSPYSNEVYRPEIKSIEFYNAAKQPSFPVIRLKTAEQVILAFDDLRGGSRNYYYTIEHCDENWNSSNLSTPDYLESYTEDRIIDYSYSAGTLQKYTHYQIRLPNDNIRPKISGNYILKVYEDSDQSKLILTRRLYVLNQRVSLNAAVVPSNDPAKRQTNQKINFQLEYSGLNVQNPNNDLHTVIMQNARPETTIVTAEPVAIQGTRLSFDDVNTNDFPGGNEFRHFDLRTLKLNSDRVSKIYKDTANTVLLLTDGTRDQPNYTFSYDLDGNFYVGNQDGRDPKIDADYAHMIFSLAAAKPAEGNVYIVGQFNNFRLDDKSRLSYDAGTHRFSTSLFLKQGVYDYAYTWVSKADGKPDNTFFEGPHFETENDYQLLVYYHPAGARWTELVGYRLLNTVNK